MQIHNIEQYTEEWWNLRLCKVSASNFEKILSGTGVISKQWQTYCYDVIATAKLGYFPETHQNAAIKHGTETEPEARACYEVLTDETVSEVGMVVHDTLPVSCSPDGLIYNDGIPVKGIEIKCPQPGTHVMYSEKKEIPVKYRPQVYGSLWLCDQVDEWVFMSYYPGLTPFLTSVKRDDPGFKQWCAKFKEPLKRAVNFIQERLAA